MTQQTIDYTYWDNAKEDFLEQDRRNPSRKASLKVILKHLRKGQGSLVELGPGMGFDYEDLFSKHSEVQYTGYEGSQGLHKRLCEKYPEGSWVRGTFDDLPPAGFDIAYTKATLEHQPELEAPLCALLKAAKSLVVINWYRPPTERMEQEYNPRKRMWYATWAKETVMKLIEPFGTCEVRPVEGSTNVLYVIRRS